MNKAILLIGPTGSGKTPLGTLMEKEGFLKKRCFHFDFGENLRKITKIKSPQIFNQNEINFIQKVLKEGTLLENEHFGIAKKILISFIKNKGIQKDDWIILNGLPRHKGQALELSSFIAIEWVILLSCTTQVVFERIKKNSGGDRKERLDDDIESIGKKLILFKERTAPLVEYYRDNGIGIEEMKVDIDTTPKDLITNLKKRTSV